MGERGKIRETVIEQTEYEDGLFHFGSDYDAGSLDAMINSLRAIRARIPEKYQKVACAIISGGDDRASISVHYFRPETAKEATARKTREAAERKRHEAEQEYRWQQMAEHDPERFARLMKKYGHLIKKPE